MTDDRSANSSADTPIDAIGEKAQKRPRVYGQGKSRNISRRRSRVVGAIDINILLAFGFGVACLAIMLGFAVWFPNPTPFQVKVFMVALSSAAAGVGALLPGTLHVEYKNTVRAGGALALFVIVWFSQPVLEQTVVTLKRPEQSANPVISAFLSNIDGEKVTEAYADLDPVSVETMVPTLALWRQLFDSNIRPLGVHKSRVLRGVTPILTSPPGLPIGIYQTFTYASQYSAINGCRIEAVTVRATQEKRWLVYSYQISPETIPCDPALKAPN